MKHVRSIFFAAALLAFTAPGVSHGQGASAGPRIVLEEEEIILLENGVEQQRIIVSKTSDERERIMSGVRERVWEKLGVSSDAEMNDKHLTSKYNEEIRRRVRVKALVPPKLKFVDASGNVIKMLDVSPTVQRDVRKSNSRSKRPHLIKETTTRVVVVSLDGQYALIAESISAGLIPETVKERAMIGDTDADYIGSQATIKLFDASGRVVWQTKTPRHMIVERQLALSDDGGLLAYIQSHEVGNLPLSQPLEQLLVFDRKGSQLLVYPKKRGAIRNMRDIVISSPAGRYVSTMGKFGDANPDFIAVFFDLRSGSMWIPSEYYYVRNLSDDGSFEASHRTSTTTETKRLNLKDHFGE